MKNLVMLLVGASILAPTPAIAGTELKAADKLVYVIPIRGEINQTMIYVVRRGVNDAVDKGADAIIFDMDTFGGRVDSAEEIIRIVSDVNIKTYTFVNPNAISAGALIALGTDHIYMAPGSSIGAAMPIMIGPEGPADIPAGMKEKEISFVAGLARRTAQKKNHDPQLAEAMVRPDMGYKIGDDVIVATNRLLTLTNVEAERLVGTGTNKCSLLSSGTVKNLNELTKSIGLMAARTIEMKISPAEGIARWIEMFSALFLIGGLLCLYIEFKTPGFGLSGIAGILLLAVWFWGYHVAGLAGMGEIFLFILGATLLFIEILIIPGFGITGIAGVVLMVTAILMGMVEHYPGTPWYEPPIEQVRNAVVVFGLSLIVTTIAAMILAKYLPQSLPFRRLTLATDQVGYQAVTQPTELKGMRGTAESQLRPAGIGLFGDRRLDVVTRGDFIDKDTPIVITEVHGGRILVEPVETTAADRKGGSVS